MNYLHDPYKKEFTTTVKAIIDDHIILEESYFYPVGGGQPHDEGTINTHKITHVKKINNQTAHKLDSHNLKPGDEVHCIIDWERRYKLMRAHTAAHIVSAVIHKHTGALITGNQLSTEKVRIDYNLDNYDPERFPQYLEEANTHIRQDYAVSSKIIPRIVAEKMPLLSKLAAGLPESVTEVRIVTIGDIDEQACAGTHVASTKEIGKLHFLKCENKGKNNRRMTFTLNDKTF